MIQYGYEGKKFALHQERLMGLVPREDLEDAMAVPGIDLGSGAVVDTMAIISLQKEIAAANLATAAASYDASHVVAVAGNAQWTNAASDPTLAVMTGVEVVRSEIGMRPNTAAIGGAVWSILRRHPQVLAQVNTNDGEKPIASRADIARLWDIPNVHVGDAIHTDEDDNTFDVWGKHVVLAYTRIGPPSRREPSFGYCYQLRGTPMTEEAYFDRDRASWLYPCTDEWSVEIAGKDAGYLLRSVVP